MGCLAVSIITVFFWIGLAEIITGSSTRNKFTNIMTGSWWVGVVIWIFPLASCYFLMRPRYYNYSLLIAIVTAAVALLGAILDGRSSLQVGFITACASRGLAYSYKGILCSGKSSDYLVAQSCFNSTQFIEPHGCYCVSNNDPRSCTEYIRNRYAKFSYDDNGSHPDYTCYDTVKQFYKIMTTSCLFCSLLFLFALLHVLYISLSRWKCMPGICDY